MPLLLLPQLASEAIRLTSGFLQMLSKQSVS